MIAIFKLIRGSTDNIVKNYFPWSQSRRMGNISGISAATQISFEYKEKGPNRKIYIKLEQPICEEVAGSPFLTVFKNSLDSLWVGYLIFL